jgi:hypothetical protein
MTKQKIKFFILCFAICFMALAGCASTKPAIVSTSINTEVVEAQGIAPIINGNIPEAKKASLHEALQYSLGLVVGIYVSQEALVSKSTLIEDNIISQTEGYIEKYSIINETVDGQFYKTTIRALVRKEDLVKKLQKLHIDDRKKFKPTISVNIRDEINGSDMETKYAENEFKKILKENDFVVQNDAVDFSLLGFVNISGKGQIASMYQFVGTVSAQILSASEDNDVITVKQGSVSGVNITQESAAMTTFQNGARRVAKELIAEVEKYLKQDNPIVLTVENISNIDELNILVRLIRSFALDVQDCRVKAYNDKKAVIEIVSKKQQKNILNLVSKLESNDEIPLKINSYDRFSIKAEKNLQR